MSVDIRGLRIAIGDREIVHGVDLTIGDGERVGLIGSSGSGKSMIARAMLGLLPTDVAVSGSIMLGGTQVVGAADRTLADLRGRYTGMIFQNPGVSLNPVVPVGKQIELPLRLFNNGEFRLFTSLRTPSIKDPNNTDLLAVAIDDNACTFAIRDPKNRDYALLNDTALTITQTDADGNPLPVTEIAAN